MVVFIETIKFRKRIIQERKNNGSEVGRIDVKKGIVDEDVVRERVRRWLGKINYRKTVLLAFTDVRCRPHLSEIGEIRPVNTDEKPIHELPEIQVLADGRFKERGGRLEKTVCQVVVDL